MTKSGVTVSTNFLVISYCRPRQLIGSTEGSPSYLMKTDKNRVGSVYCGPFCIYNETRTLLPAHANQSA